MPCNRSHDSLRRDFRYRKWKDVLHSQAALRGQRISQTWLQRSCHTETPSLINRSGVLTSPWGVVSKIVSPQGLLFGAEKRMCFRGRCLEFCKKCPCGSPWGCSLLCEECLFLRVWIMLLCMVCLFLCAQGLFSGRWYSKAKMSFCFCKWWTSYFPSVIACKFHVVNNTSSKMPGVASV